MAHNKLFRNFIILQEDKKFKASKDDSKKQLSGYTKIEAKGERCKITFYAQNLEKDNKYYILLVCYKKDNRKIINLGTIEVNETGKGEKTKEYYLNNIAGLNLSYDDISGAAICKMINESFEYILYGFGNGETVQDDWKKCKVYNHDEVKEKNDNMECLKEKKIKKEEHKHNHSEKDEHKSSKNKDKDIEHKEEKEEKEEKPKECLKEMDECIKPKVTPECENCLKCNRELARNKFDKYEEEIEKKKNEIVNPFDFELSGSMGKFFEGVVSDFEEISKGFSEMEYCKWYKAAVASIDDMCDTSNYNKYTIAYYPMINYYPYIKKYGYFVVGFKCDNKGNIKYIIYGVPGSKDKSSQPYGGKTGFVTWMKTNNNEGLWLMFYDYKKSIVVIPAKE